ncbi:S66 peptidase family protein [Niallia sp. 03133]|uniref:S66 peptidase family protein n=1 Tax=Niallia sp. 03133 TaxID=3458060 RepID=UPI004044AC14
MEVKELKPIRLQKGDTVAVIAPASPPNKTNVEKGIAFLENIGLKVNFGNNLFRHYGYLAGSDQQRLDDFHWAFADKDIKGIICACGGYGTARIAEGIDYSIIEANPKVFWGYSDITYLHHAIFKQTGLTTFHGPMLSSDIGMPECHPLTKHMFQQLFEPTNIIYTEEYSPLKALVVGRAAGLIVGGNLSLITSTLGTSFEIDTKSKILLIEDVHEEPRAVDRMLNQLQLAGKLHDAEGFIVGDFHDCEPKREHSLSLEDVIDTYITRTGKPALKGFKIGHCSPSIAVPLGAYAELDTSAKKLTIEAGVQ